MFSTPQQIAARRQQPAGAAAHGAFSVPRASRGGTPGAATADGSTYSLANASPQQQRRKFARRTRTPLLLDAGAGKRTVRSRASRAGTPGLASERASTPGTEGTAAAGAGARAYLSSRQEELDGHDAARWIQPGTELVRDDVHAVTAYSRLPDEVEAALAEADLYSKPFKAELDVSLGYAVLASATQCYVWNFLASAVASGHASPTCYAFDLPSDASAGAAPQGAYLYVLVPWSNSTQRAEPGLVAVHRSTGQLRLFPNIATSSGLDVQQGPANRIVLAPGEAITVAHRLSTSSNTILLATSHARLFRVRVISQGGRAQLLVEQQPLASARSLLGKLFFGGVDAGAAAAAAVASASGAEHLGSVRTLTSRALSTGVESDGKHELLAVTGRTLQRWLVDAGVRAGSDGSATASATSGGDKLLGTFELRALFEQSERYHPLARGAQLEAHDAQFLVGGDIALLYSSSEAGASRRYGILLLSTSPVTDSRQAARADRSSAPLRIRAVHQLSHSPSKSRAHSDVRLAAPFGGPVLHVIGPNAIVALILGRALLPDAHAGGGDMSFDGDVTSEGAGSDELLFELSVNLKHAQHNRFLGFGVEGADVSPPAQAGGASVAPLPVLTAKSGALLFEVDWRRANDIIGWTHSGSADSQQSAASRLEIATERAQSQLEAAVFFGDLPGNPLEFRVQAPPPGSSQQTALTAAVRNVSASLVNSSSPYLPSIIDTYAQLSERLRRHHRLVEVLGSSGAAEAESLVWDSLGADVQEEVRDNSLLLAAALEIWSETEAQSASESRLLRQGVGAVASGSDSQPGSDPLREFFMHHLGTKLVSIFAWLASRLNAGDLREAPLDVKTSTVLQVDRIVVSAFQGARKWVEESGHEYEPWPGKPLTSRHESWTLAGSAIEALQASFDVTKELLQQRTRSLGTGVDMEIANFASEGTQAQREQQELKSHLVSLATFALAAYEQRLAYLARTAGDQSERQALAGHFASERPDIIHALVRIDRSDQAFSLAERHRDFRVLAQLCTEDEHVGSTQTLLHHYLDRYGEPFAFQLFEHFVTIGQYRALLEQHEAYTDLLAAFLAAHPELSSISWIQDIGRGRFGDASGTLASVAVNEKGLASQQLEFSLAKLAYAAALTEDDIAQAEEQLELQRIDDKLDVVYVQTRLRETISKQLSDNQCSSDADAYASIFAVRLEVFPALRQHFLASWQACIAGQVLGIEDLIDVLTLKDNVDEASEPHFIQALQSFVRTRESLPDARRDAILRAFWRRVLLHDAWSELSNTAGKTDAEVKEALRETELYRVVNSISPEDVEDALILPTAALLEAPSREVLRGRFENSGASKSESELDALLADYAAEVGQLQELLDHGLDKWFDETKRVAMSDMADGADENDEDMEDESEMMQ